MTTFPMLPPNHVLVASPNSAIRQRVLESLRSRARRVEQTREGAEALGHLEEGDWQVLFLDRRRRFDAEELSHRAAAFSAGAPRGISSFLLAT